MKKTIILSVLLAVILSCSKKNECKEEVLAAKHFESDYGCTNTKHILSVNLNNNFTVISSKEDYDSKVSGACHPAIDFSLYDLIIGKQTSANFNDTIIYDYRRACPKNELTLSVDIVQSLLTQPDNVVYHAIVPKIAGGETLNISITVR
jgi:hypothetical protein